MGCGHDRYLDVPSSQDPLILAIFPHIEKVSMVRLRASDFRGIYRKWADERSYFLKD
jgi:hypothetical protein